MINGLNGHSTKIETVHSNYVQSSGFKISLIWELLTEIKRNMIFFVITC